jgi:glycosyltransferase 2 family protein
MDQTGQQLVERSPSDVLRAVVAAVVLLAVLVLQALFGDTLVEFSSDLLRGLDALPQWIVEAIIVGTRVLASVLLLGGIVVAVARGRWRMLLTTTAGAAIAAILVALTGLLDTPSGSTSLTPSRSLGAIDGSEFPTVAGIALIAAIITAAAPWLSRRWRRLGWLLVLGLVVTRFATAPVSFDTLRAVLDGWLGGALALVALGAPARKPTQDAVADGLRGVGVDLAELKPASVDARGSTPYFGVDTNGRSLFVKVLGSDERSADLLFRMYRGILPRHLGDERPFSSLRRAVEHEALVALAATSFGVHTPTVVGFAAVEPNGFVLVYEGIAGRSLDRVDDAELTDDVLSAIWDQIALLRTHRIAHRDLRLANMFLDDAGAVWMIDFGFSELAASNLLLATDLAELLSATSLKVGPERAVAAARRSLDAEALSTAQERLRPFALSGATRTALKERPELLEQIGALVTA